MADDYFSGLMVTNRRFMWTVATRQQFELWEQYLSPNLWRNLYGQPMDDRELWLGAIAHHFTLVAARHLMKALDLRDPCDIAVNAIVKSELTEGRDLHEHWEDNMPIFNVTPRPKQPTHRTGKSYAARNPTESPYPVLPWSDKTGAMVMPNVSAFALHDLLDLVEASVLAECPPYADVLPPRRESPWISNEDECWPRPIE